LAEGTYTLLTPRAITAEITATHLPIIIAVGGTIIMSRITYPIVAGPTGTRMAISRRLMAIGTHTDLPLGTDTRQAAGTIDTTPSTAAHVA
jgi:hypothetical protein